MHDLNRHAPQQAVSFTAVLSVDGPTVRPLLSAVAPNTLAVLATNGGASVPRISPVVTIGWQSSSRASAKTISSWPCGFDSRHPLHKELTVDLDRADRCAGRSFGGERTAPPAPMRGAGGAVVVCGVAAAPGRGRAGREHGEPCAGMPSPLPSSRRSSPYESGTKPGALQLPLTAADLDNFPPGSWVVSLHQRRGCDIHLRRLDVAGRSEKRGDYPVQSFTPRSWVDLLQARSEEGRYRFTGFYRVDP
jgi:hypothetical protein